MWRLSTPPFAELLGEVGPLHQEEPGDAGRGRERATLGKFELAKLAKQYNLDAIHDTVHEMAPGRGPPRQGFSRAC